MKMKKKRKKAPLRAAGGVLRSAKGRRRRAGWRRAARKEVRRHPLTGETPTPQQRCRQDSHADIGGSQPNNVRSPPSRCHQMPVFVRLVPPRKIRSVPTFYGRSRDDDRRFNFRATSKTPSDASTIRRLCKILANSEQLAGNEALILCRVIGAPMSAHRRASQIGRRAYAES